MAIRSFTVLTRWFQTILVLAVSVTWICVGQSYVQAQQPDVPSVSQSSPSNADVSVQTEATSKPENRDDKESSRRGSIVIAPIPTSSPTTGTGITLMAGYIFPLSKSDKISPPSVIGGAALITNNGTRAWAAGTELYFKQDRYHILAGFAHGDLNYDFYGTGSAAGDAGRKFGLNQTGNVVFAEALRKVFWRMFVGPRLWMGSSELVARNVSENHPQLPPLGVNFDMRSLGFKIERDTVPNRFYPTQGSAFQFTADFFSKDLGGTFSFQTYRTKFNIYHSFGEKQVLAYNAFVCGTGGNAPFFGQCIFGFQDELRGYPAGRYIDKTMFATQGEYRRTLFWRLGAVGFAGVGEVAPGFSSFNTQDLLPSVGGGVRFMLSRKYHVNLRMDIAQGKNEHTFSMSLGEAF